MGADRQAMLARSLHRRAHLRLVIAAIIGVGVSLFTGNTDFATRSLIGWDVGVTILLLGIWRMMATTTLAELRMKAAQQDETAPVILGLMLTAVAASLWGIVAEIGSVRHPADHRALAVAVPVATLVLSWLCMHMLFATHYAHRFYGDRAGGEPGNPGLIFPEKQPTPGYMEFVYFAFCIGMTYQVSDVMTATRTFRRLITLHGALSFFYNTFVLAWAVNLFSMLASSG